MVEILCLSRMQTMVWCFLATPSPIMGRYHLIITQSSRSMLAVWCCLVLLFAKSDLVCAKVV